jgi:5-(hydroxymethyl)furfural/furfural oxidase
MSTALIANRASNDVGCSICIASPFRPPAFAATLAAMTELPQGDASIDVVIVGGGSAGAVLAARLSEDASRSVMLIESGPDVSPASIPSVVASPYPGFAYVDPRLTMPYPGVLAGGAHWNDQDARPRLAYAQGHSLGGGSTINGLGANRGAPSDYDEWDALGATGWTWESVLPYFRKLERDLEFDGPLHGKDGPLPVRSAPTAWRSGFVRAAIDALRHRGIDELPDQNGAWRDGVFAQRINLDEGMRRVPTSVGWLTREVRSRDNLTILTGIRATRLVIEGARTTGVRVDLGLMENTIPARHVVVATGAFGSPALLMRSGIGPADHLASRGIAIAADRPGVGRNLMDHPYAGVSAHLPRASRVAHDDTHHIPAIWRFSSGLDGCPQGDMHMGFIGRVAWHAMGRRIGALAFWVNKSFSRGDVRLARDPDEPPLIDLRLLSDERDRIRLRQAFHIAAALALDMQAAGAIGQPLPARLSDRARAFGARTMRNAILTRLAAMAVDGAGPFAAAVSRALTHDGPSLADLLADKRALDDYLDRSVTGVWHPCGTCRMGAADDRMAVTDARGRVHGIENLSVCDASIFPSIPCANLNVPVIMAAERIADIMRGRALR